MKATAKMKEPERKCNGANRRRPPPPPLGNQRALGNEGGRPTDYRPEYAEQARKLCQLGATDAELAQFFEVNHSTIFEWRAAHPEFSDALKIGKSFADERMKRSLYQRGIGYDYQSVKIVEEGVIGDKDGKLTLVKRTTSTEHVAGDVGAQKLWLTNAKMPSRSVAPPRSRRSSSKSSWNGASRLCQPMRRWLKASREDGWRRPHHRSR
jgi:hypothetical protein